MVMVCNAATSSQEKIMLPGGKIKIACPNLDEKFGDGTAEELYVKSKEVVKFSNDELLDKINYYKELVDSMK